MKKKLLSIILTVMLVLSVCSVVPVALAAGNEVTVIYRYFDEAGNLRDGLGNFYDVDYVNSDTDEFNGGTYVVSGKVTVDDSIEVTESANLVLLDGCELTVTEGIEVEGSHTLAIYAQSTGENKGKLFTTGCNDSAGIGSNVGLIPIGNSCGYIDIYGGYIEATGGYKAAGIGGGTGLSGGTVVVYDGEIVAKGGLCGAGIGGGCDANGGKLTVYGGKITATGGSGKDDSRGSAGIGGGEHGNGGEVIIYDGKITAQGECGAAGIGGGCNGDGGTVSIYGGYVNALTRVLYIDGEAVLSDERYLLGAGIGGGCYGNGGNVMLYGGEVVASIKDDGYDDCYLRAIGGGDDSDSNGSVNYASGMLVYDCRANKYLNDDFTHTDLTNYFTGRDDVVHFRLTRTKGKVSYKEYDPDTWSFTTKTCEDYTIVKKNITSWKDGWYVADTTGTINGTVTVTGDVHLILESGTILTVEGGVRVEEGSSLTIYSQVEDIPQGDRFVISASANCAGIGGGNGKNSGNITVHGANLVVNGGENAAAIGGGNGGNGGIFTVYSGRVTANAGSGASRAIGAGVGGSHNGEIYLRDGYNAHSYIVSPDIPEREPGQKWVNLITGSNVDFRLNPISKNHTNNPESYKYYDEDMVENDGSCTEYLPIFDDTRSLSTGWYVVNGELTVDNKLSVYGDVKLILKDGCKFTTDGILVASGGTLTVYGQSNGTGELVAEGDGDGITVGGTLNIHGGTVTATGVEYECAGIFTTNGMLNIFGGTVTAAGGARAAGIGGSYYAEGGNITINGGKVTATGGSLGAGIGGGYKEGAGNITINGGEVTAVSGSSAAAIGCGNEGSGGDVTVTGGTVNADGSTGIGIGSNSSSIRKINLFIYGGYITAKSKSGNDVIIANKVRLSPEKCESFKVLLDNSEAEGSPYTALAEIYNVFAGHGFAHIESNFNHNVVDGYCTVCGAQVFDTYITRSWDAGEKKVVSTETNIPEYIQKITEDTTELPGGLYVVEGEVTVEEKITVSGDAGLILKDGCILTLKNGLEISSKGVLTVYGQAGGTGKLKVPKLSENTAAIGVEPGAELNVHGGNIEVYGGNYAAGIGGGYRGDSGDVTVYGGSITAYGGANGAGIGGGASGAGGTFTIYGGKVDAHGSYSSGIGGGQSGAGGTIIINGGEVGSGGNIGSGYQYGPASGSTVVINGGTVNVSGDNSNVGGNGSTVEINGGEVKIAQGTLGVGYNGSNCNITIRGGNIDAFCYYYPAIGGNTSNVKVNIYGGTIKAQSTKMDAIVATSVNVYPDAEKCERFTVKDLSGNELSGSPITAETDISGIISENKQIEINRVTVHVYTGDYVDNNDGTHSRTCECGSSLSKPENHTFENHTCVCGAKNNHNFTGDYVNNGDGTHSRKCTVCGEPGTSEAHIYEDGVCTVCGAKEPKPECSHTYVMGTCSKCKYHCPHTGVDEDSICYICVSEITSITYITRSWDSDKKEVVSTVTGPEKAVVITDKTTELYGGLYVVDSDISTQNRIVVKGTADDPTNIVLAGGYTLEAKAGIEVDEGNVLNIYDTPESSGKIIAGNENDLFFNHAAIGGNEDCNGGTVTVYGGTVTATSTLGAGIGGGDYCGNGGIFTIYGGTVTATSTSGAGIGVGANGSGASFTMYGGTVTASSKWGAGVGAGYNSSAHGEFTVAEGIAIKAGKTAYNAVSVTAEEYKTSRSAYVNLHAHDFTGDYVDNGDGTHSQECTVCGAFSEPENHTYEDGVCVCGAVCDAPMKIKSASLHIAEDINVIYAAEVPEGCTDPYMVFTLNDRTYTVDTYTLNSKGQYCFELAAVTPQCMGDNISATLYATVDGCTASVTKAEYSVRAYCVSMLAKTNDDLFVTLLSDLLTYGAAAQTYTNYKTDTLVTDGLSLFPSTFPELSGLKEEFVGTEDPDTIWKSASLTLRNNVDMNLCFVTDSIEGLSVVLEINGRTETVTDFTPVDGEENLYRITFHGILATEFDLPVSASFYRDGAQVGNTLNYSVNTYICSKQNDSDKALAAMVRALYNYGATANTYYFERYLKQ